MSITNPATSSFPLAARRWRTFASLLFLLSALAMSLSSCADSGSGNTQPLPTGSDEAARSVATPDSRRGVASETNAEDPSGEKGPVVKIDGQAIDLYFATPPVITCSGDATAKIWSYSDTSTFGSDVEQNQVRKIEVVKGESPDVPGAIFLTIAKGADQSDVYTAYGDSGRPISVTESADGSRVKATGSATLSDRESADGPLHELEVALSCG